LPKVDIIDHDGDIEVQAALPGVRKEDVDVSITIRPLPSALPPRKKKGRGKGKYFRREISRGEYQRTLSLPDNVDGDNAKASFKRWHIESNYSQNRKSKRKTLKLSNRLIT